ncbi:hypothetical protein F5Y10DRAFT_242054 [Nemania abortiva]|nr:hypothetical protein F5Y10DRAFT_242054 [Nemania abortiva]
MSCGLGTNNPSKTSLHDRYAMSIAFTFGSLGDIIALSQIAIQLGRALAGNATGSSQQYKDLREELNVFTRVLMQVIEAYQQHEVTPFLTSLDVITKTIVDDCGCLIQDVLEKLAPRYSQSLGESISGRRIKGFVKTIEWSLRETERVEELREKLHRNSLLLGMLISIATRHSARADSDTLLERITEVRDLVSKQERETSSIPSIIQENASKQDRRLRSIEANLNTQIHHNNSLVSVVSNEFSDLKRMITETSNNSVAQHISVSNTQYLRSLDPTRELPIWFEDALGRELKLPIEWIKDWKSLYNLIEGYCGEGAGGDMVRRKEYILEEDRSGQDLDDSQPLITTLRRGMKINMAMVFVNANIVSGFCPGCQREVDAPEGITFQCPRLDCGMWFKSEKITQPRVRTALRGRPPSPWEEPVVLLPPSKFHRVRLRMDDILGELIPSRSDDELLIEDNDPDFQSCNSSRIVENPGLSGPFTITSGLLVGSGFGSSSDEESDEEL